MKVAIVGQASLSSTDKQLIETRVSALARSGVEDIYFCFTQEMAPTAALALTTAFREAGMGEVALHAVVQNKKTDFTADVQRAISEAHVIHELRLGDNQEGLNRMLSADFARFVPAVEGLFEIYWSGKLTLEPWPLVRYLLREKGSYLMEVLPVEGGCAEVLLEAPGRRKR